MQVDSRIVDPIVDRTGTDALSEIVLRQRDFDVTIGQCVVSVRNLARAVLIRRKTLFDGEVKVCLLP